MIMNTLEKWENLIKRRGGIYKGWSIRASAEVTELFVSGTWFDRTKENKNKQKDMRDLTAQELRKEKWSVRTRSNSGEYYLDAEFFIKHDKKSIAQHKKMVRLHEEKVREFMDWKPKNFVKRK
jgi:predicted nuclease of restriction endonuclease-like (RecB) superfamily